MKEADFEKVGEMTDKVIILCQNTQNVRKKIADFKEVLHSQYQNGSDNLKQEVNDMMDKFDFILD